MRPSRVFLLGLLILVVGAGASLYGLFGAPPENWWGLVGAILAAAGCCIATLTLLYAQGKEEASRSVDPTP